MPLRTCFFFLIAIFLAFTTTGQNTVGTILDNDGSQEGLTFFSPFSGSKAYLVDNCGRLINQWDRGTRPGLSAYFLENGLMFRTFKPPPKGPFTSASNAGGLEMVDWDNNTVWAYEINSATQLSHHDAVVMPNGNILVLTWQLAYANELIELGRDPDKIDPAGFAWSEKIMEIQPLDSNRANIIWEWQVKDHYVQDYDSTKLGFGIVSEHPELFNINLPELNSPNSHSNFDWNHFNSIDYEVIYDQILISVRNSDEVWVIDHSTSTEEASSHSGGRYGKGGDLLYRWGNPSAYERGNASDQELYGQHGVNWISQGLENAGSILIFNNGNGRPGTDYSTTEILNPARDIHGGYILPENIPFGPQKSDQVYGGDPGSRHYSPYLSNAQRLDNGNTLINYGSLGTILEVDLFKDVVWEYVIPLNGDAPLAQGQYASNNSSFRAYKYPIDYVGFAGLDLTPGETIESGTDISKCQESTATDGKPVIEKIQIVWRYSDQYLEINSPLPVNLGVSVIDVAGRILFRAKKGISPLHIHVPSLSVGIYFVRIEDDIGSVRTYKIFNPFNY